MRILMFTRYGRLGASSRMRSYQYLPWLATAGIDVTVSPFFSDAYVAGLQRGEKTLREVTQSFPQRIKVLLYARRFDLVWIEKESLPWLPAWLELALLPSGTPFVLDYDDAVFHSYDQHHHPWVRRLLAGKHPRLIRRAALVVAGNAYLASFAEAASARQVAVVPTVVDLARYPAPGARHADQNDIPTIGWIGQRATASFLKPLAPVFQNLAAEARAQFTAVGIDAAALGLPMMSVPWTEDTEVASISRFDVGIMPLVDEPFERGKCGYKLIQYMACGLPVVASPVGVNCQIVEHGVNGFLAETPAQWQQALETLLADAGLRQRMGRAGRQKVEQHYSLQVTGPRLAALLKAASAPEPT